MDSDSANGTHARVMGDIKGSRVLFKDFFPRLRARALERYGEALSVRQFTNWREKRLLAGPADPIGQGRGLAPLRHWPISSYRRALRLCRYKSWGMHRQSQWWIALWLSGEEIPAETLRQSFKREHSLERRNLRNIIDSGRWQKGPFISADDKAFDVFGNKELINILFSASGISPDVARKLFIADFEGGDYKDHKKLAMSQFNKDEQIFIAEQLKGDASTSYIRPGYLNEGKRKPGDYLDALSAEEFDIARRIFRKWLWFIFIEIRVLIMKKDVTPNDSFLPFMFFSNFCRASRAPFQISFLMRILFGIFSAKRDGIDPKTQLKEISETVNVMLNRVSELIKGFRNDKLI